MHTKPRKASRPSPTEARGAGQQRRSARAGLGGVLRLRGGLGTCGLAPDAVCVCAGVTVGLSSWERLWVFKRDESGA